MIKFENVSFGFPQKDLYNNISFEIEDNEHAVIIGSNGTGKSTLINLIINPDIYTYDGNIIKENVGRIGYVPQFVKHEKEEISVFSFLASPFTNLQKKADLLCKEMENAEDLDKIYEKYQLVLDEIDSIDGYNYESNIRKELAISNLSHLENIPISKISGGEYKLLSIIKNMLLRPHVLIMDEPDVFLDFENIVSLSKLLNNYNGTTITVTHNRLLLNQCFNKILHIEGEALQEFPGTFSEYNNYLLETKIEMYASAVSFDEFIEIQETLIEKMRKRAEFNPDPKKGKQLKARVTYLEKLKNMRGDDPFLGNLNYTFNLPDVEECSYDEPILSIKNYSLKFEDVILDNVSFDVNRGEKIAIVGPNGTGKSSILNDIYNMYLESHDTNSIEYFKQIYDDDNTEKMSGGELNINRLKALEKSSASLLLLDEPTSHLGTYAQIGLENAINKYNGTVILVSHDFFTITNCASRILLIEDKTIREVSPRSYRKAIYKKYFDSDIFENEKKRIEKEMKVITLLKKGKYVEAKLEFNKA